MTHHSALRRILALAAMAAIAAGCGTPPAPTAPSAPRYAPLQAQAPQQQQPPEVTEIFPFLADIGLTASQKGEIRSLLEQQEAPVSRDEAQQRGERFLELLSSRTLDEEALETFFATSVEESRQQTMAAVRLFTGIRDTLTARQRSEAARQIRDSLQETEEAPQQAPPNTEAPQEQPLDLNLTDEQQAAFDALRPEADPQASVEALAAFFEEGDEAALQEAMLGDESVEDQVEQLVAAYAGLTYQQRRQLVSHMRQQANQPSRGS